MKRYFTCEIKTANRCHQVTVNKWVIVIETNHLNGWLIQEQSSEMQNCVWWLCLELYLLSKKTKNRQYSVYSASLLIDLLYTELSLKIIIYIYIYIFFF